MGFLFCVQVLIMKEIQLVGGGGLAKDIISCFQQEVFISGIWDDGLPVGSTFFNIPVLGSIANLIPGYAIPLLIAVGNPIVRKNIFDKLADKEITPETLIHSTARIFHPESVLLGKGCLLMPYSYITNSVSLGENCLLHIHAGLHHDVQLGAHAVLMPGARITCGFTSSECYLLDTNEVIKISRGTH